jgi:hypothetical protein
VLSHNRLLQAAMSGMRRVVRGRWAGPSGPTVTKIFDRCRYTVTAASARGRACSSERAPACRAALRPPITPLAGVVVTLGATVTTASIDTPDLLGSRGGLGTLVRMWQAFLSRCRRMGLFD